MENERIKTLYGTLSRGKIIQLLRRNKLASVWDLCLIVTGIEPNHDKYPPKFAGKSGGMASRLYALACQAKLADANNAKGNGQYERHAFMKWLGSKDVFPDGLPKPEAVGKDVVARTLYDYQGYQKTKPSSPERDKYIKDLSTDDGRQKQAEIMEEIQRVKNHKKCTTREAAQQLLEEKHPCTLKKDGNPYPVDTLVRYHSRAGLM